MEEAHAKEKAVWDEKMEKTTFALDARDKQLQQMLHETKLTRSLRQSRRRAVTLTLAACPGAAVREALKAQQGAAKKRKLELKTGKAEPGHDPLVAVAPGGRAGAGTTAAESGPVVPSAMHSARGLAGSACGARKKKSIITRTRPSLLTREVWGRS